MEYFKKRKYSILSKLSSLSFVFIIALSLMGPAVFVKAECDFAGDRSCDTDTSSPESVSTYTSDTNTDVSTDDNIRIQTKIINPLGAGNLETIPAFIIKIIEVVLTVGVPIVALAIIYSGFLFVTAQGDPTKLKEAKKAILNTLIGAVLLLGAFVIANAIGKTVEDIKSGQ